MRQKKVSTDHELVRIRTDTRECVDMGPRLRDHEILPFADLRRSWFGAMKRAVSSLNVLIVQDDQVSECDQWSVWLENLFESSTRSKAVCVGRGKTRNVWVHECSFARRQDSVVLVVSLGERRGGKDRHARNVRRRTSATSGL